MGYLHLFSSEGPRVTIVLSVSQGGVCDPASGGHTPIVVGVSAALTLQSQVEGLQAPPAGAHGTLRPAAATGDSPALPAVP